MEFDPDHLLLFNIFIFALKGFFLVVTFRLRKQAFFGWLAVACFAYSLGWLLVLGCLSMATNVISLSLAKILISLFPVFVIVATFSFLGKPYLKKHLYGTILTMVMLFVILTQTRYQVLLSDLSMSVINGFFYVTAAGVLLKYARPKTVAFWSIIAANLLISVILYMRADMLLIEYFSPGIFTQRSLNFSLFVALFVNILCIDTQILCFQIFDFTKARSDLEGVNQKLLELAHRDALTNLFNRRALSERLTVEILRCEHQAASLSVILLDLDHFKTINDQFGHDVGDLVLVHVAQLIETMVRPADMVVRYGGEEFLVLLLDTGLSGAVEVAERLRAAVTDLVFLQDHATPSLQVTASFGVATLSTESATANALLRAADVALYRAKEAGRNRVVTATPTLIDDPASDNVLSPSEDLFTNEEGSTPPFGRERQIG